jgi:hypothetical protein
MYLPTLASDYLPGDDSLAAGELSNADGAPTILLG